MTIGNHERAQSEVMGVVLVVSITVMGITGVMFFGTQALSDAQRSSDISSAEHSYTQFDSTLSLVAHGDSTRQSVPLPNHRDANQYVSTAGWMNISIKSEAGDVQEINQSLGGVVYESRDTKIAYQGGGIWKQSDGGSTMVSPPEFHYRDDTLTLPLIVVEGEGTVTDEIGFTKTDETAVYPTDGASNPLTGGNVTITVQSDYYEAWGRFFEQRTKSEVEYDNTNKRVDVILVVPTDVPSVAGAVVSNTAGSPMTINNNAVVDSYNSSESTYSPRGNNGSIVVAGDLILEKGDIYGDVVVGGTFEFAHNNGQLHDGNISYGNNIIYKKSESDHWDAGPEYWIEQNADVEAPESVSGLISQRLSELENASDNDNDAEEAIDSRHIDCTSDCTIESGSYFLDSFDVNDELTLDTSGGDINIGVEGPANINHDIEVIGDNRVNVYLSQDASFSNDVQVGNRSHDDSTDLWLYMRSNKRATLQNNVNYTGVIFGPSHGGVGGTEVVLNNNAHVYGGIVGDIDVQQNNVEIHYDEALANTEAIAQDTSYSSLSYLHISINEVTVEER